MNIFQRLVNRAGHPFGIRLFPWADELKLRPDSQPSRLFDAIHESNYWGSEESISGGGSTQSRTEEYVRQLAHTIHGRNIRSMFDAPCGDLNWISPVIDSTSIHYIGGDVSEIALEVARKRRPGTDLRLFDIRQDQFPEVDLWHCRDCLFHLSFDDGLAALRNFARSKIPFALITTNSGIWVRNMDIVTGGHRVTDLERAPYNLPRPVTRLPDYPKGREFPRYVGLWSRDQIASAVA